ncbi:MAG: hypothetical protein ACFB03_13640 [Paracoccaceae bacterium]
MRFFSIIALLLVSGCVQLTTESLPSESVGPDYVLELFNWQDGDQMTVGIKTFESKGRVGICGAYAEYTPNAGYAEDLNQRALAAAQVRFAGETLVRGLDFFGRGGHSKDSLPAAQANCVLTDRPWEARFERTKPRIRWGKTTFIVEY